MRYVYLVNTTTDEQGRRLFEDYKRTDELTAAHIGSEMGGTPNVQTCEVIYRIFNTDERPHAYRGPSMSHGDVLIFPEFNAIFAVASFGFRRVEADAATLLVNAKPIPAEWRR